MKKILILLAASFGLSLAACNEESIPYERPAEVTAHSISGDWQLTEWHGAPLADGSFVYLSLTRKESRFTIYQNIDSFATRVLTGTFNITFDERDGYIIRGLYDHSMSSEWAHRYIVTEFSDDRMVWTAQDDPADRSVYCRCTIPEEILAAAPEE